MEITTLNRKGWRCNRISKDEMKDDDFDLTVKGIWEALVPFREKSDNDYQITCINLKKHTM